MNIDQDALKNFQVSSILLMQRVMMLILTI